MFGIPDYLHRHIYFAGLALLAIALPSSIFLTSVAEITLAINWLIEKPFSYRWNIFKNKRSVQILLLFYLVHIMGMIYTRDFEWGIHDLRIKLPMLFLPLVIGTSTDIQEKNIKHILNLFIGSLLVISLWKYYQYLQQAGNVIVPFNKLHMHVDHIRLSLMIIVSLCSIIWLAKRMSTPFRWIYLPAVIWLLFVLVLLQSLTGLFVLIITSIVLLIRAIILSRNTVFRRSMTSLMLLFIVIISVYCVKAYERFYSFDKVDPAKIAQETELHHSYTHDFQDKSVENGHFISLYICEPELRDAWNKRSKIPYEQPNVNGFPVKYVLVRYMTSKSLHKDAQGMSQMTPMDIKNVEAGITNFIYLDKFSFYPRIYTLLWEIHQYRSGYNPTGFSVAQRFEALKTVADVISKHPWVGVGTGDIRYAIASQYEENQNRLALPNRIRAHNQLITFVATFGLIGFLIIMFSLLYPVIIEKKFSNYLFLMFFVIIFLSFLDEDTLEIHTGISFFAFFYAVFLFAKDDSKPTNRTDH